MARFSKRRESGAGERSGRRSAVVIGRWADDAALLRLDDGTTREVSVPEELRERVDVGTRTTVGTGESDDVKWEVGDERRFRRPRFWHRSRT